MLPVAQESFAVVIGKTTNIGYDQTSFSGIAYGPKGVISIRGGGHTCGWRTSPFACDVSDPSKLTANFEPMHETTPLSEMTPDNLSNVAGPPLPNGAKFWLSRMHPISSHGYQGWKWLERLQCYIQMMGGNGAPYDIGAAWTAWNAAHPENQHNSDTDHAGGTGTFYDPVKKTYRASASLTKGGNGGGVLDAQTGWIIGGWAGGKFIYDPADDSVVNFEHGDTGEGYDNTFVHHEETDRFFVVARNGWVYEFDVDRVKKWAGNVRRFPMANEITDGGWWGNSRVTEFVYDRANKLCVGGLKGGILHAFDPRDPKWITMDLTAVTQGSTCFHCHAYDHDQNVHYIVLDGTYELLAVRWGGSLTTPPVIVLPPAATITQNGQPQPDLMQAGIDGGEIQIGAGRVNQAGAFVKPVHIVGTGRDQTLIDSAGVNAWGKGALVVEAGATVEDLEIANAAVGDQNGAGIRHDGGDLIANRVRLRNCQDGYLGTNQPVNVTFNDAEVLDCGAGDGQSHGIYAGECTSLAVDKAVIRGTKIGHHIKSRAKKTTLRHLELGSADYSDTASYCIDLPEGGEALIEDGVLRKGPHSDNDSAMVTYAAESRIPGGSLTFRRMVFDNQDPACHDVLFNKHAPDVIPTFEDCTFINVQPPANAVLISTPPPPPGDTSMATVTIHSDDPSVQIQVVPTLPTDQSAQITELQGQVTTLTQQLADANAHAAALQAKIDKAKTDVATDLA